MKKLIALALFVASVAAVHTLVPVSAVAQWWEGGEEAASGFCWVCSPTPRADGTQNCYYQWFNKKPFNCKKGPTQ